MSTHPWSQCFDWTADRVEQVKRLAANGSTATEIAKELGGTTRNAVLGKLFRMGLKTGNRKGGRKGISGNPRGINGRSKTQRSPLARVFGQGRTPPHDKADAPRPIPPAPNSRPVDIMGLTNATCRFPLWENPDEPKLFCGALECDNSRGIFYCPFHAALSVNRRGGG